MNRGSVAQSFASRDKGKGGEEGHYELSRETMTREDKARAKADELKGRAKEAAGEDFGRPDIAREGRAQQRKGAARGALEKLKDVFRPRR